MVGWRGGTGATLGMMRQTTQGTSNRSRRRVRLVGVGEGLDLIWVGDGLDLIELGDGLGQIGSGVGYSLGSRRSKGLRVQFIIKPK